MAKKRKTLSDQLRAEIERARTSGEMSRYRLAKETGITQAILSRFATGKAGITMETADKIGAVLGLTLTREGKSR